LGLPPTGSGDCLFVAFLDRNVTRHVQLYCEFTTQLYVQSQSACITREKETVRDTFFFKKKSFPSKKNKK
jgi:hypothetical protein